MLHRPILSPGSFPEGRNRLMKGSVSFCTFPSPTFASLRGTQHNITQLIPRPKGLVGVPKQQSLAQLLKKTQKRRLSSPTKHA